VRRIAAPVAVALWPLSVVYGWVVAAKRTMYERGWFGFAPKRLDGVVISVGNLTAGGTGKTPMVMWLAEKFLAEGKSVAVLTRGYKGAGGTSDEVEVMKRRLGERVRFGVGADRFLEGRKLEARGRVDTFLLDDGFQHLRLARDLDILMVDGSRSLERDWLLPAGLLREPISAGRRADIVIGTRGFDLEASDGLGARDGRVFCADTKLLGFRRLGADGGLVEVGQVRGGPVFAFCGIGNSAGFFADLNAWQMRVAGTRDFPDHHKYSAADVEAVQRATEAAGAAALVTTEKDEANLRGLQFRVPVWVAVIEFGFADEVALKETIDRQLRERRGAAA
jgi:tetraacyldisaccharide 4'-kinase